MREPILKVRESDKLVSAGIVLLFFSLGIIVLGFTEIKITGWEDVIILGLSAAMSAGIGIFCVIARINHKLDIYDDGSLCYQTYSGKSVEFAVKDISVIEQKSTKKETSILIKGKKGQILAKIESNMTGYHELLEWLDRQGIKRIELEKNISANDRDENTEERAKKVKFYQNKMWIKKLRIINVVLWWSIFPIVFLVRESLTAIYSIILLYQLLWFGFYLCFHRVMYFVAPKRKETAELTEWKGMHIRVPIEAIILCVLLMVETTAEYTAIKGNEYLAFGVIYAIAIVLYFAVSWKDKIEKHLIIIIIMAIYIFLSIMPLNWVLSVNENYKTEWGVLEKKRVVDGKYGMNYYLDVKLDKDHTIYSFSVDKDEFDWYQLNGGVEFNVWESMLGFEYAKVKEVEY